MFRRELYWFLLALPLFLSGCSLLYMNAVRTEVGSLRLVDGEKREDVQRRLGTPIEQKPTSDTFRIRGRLDVVDDARVAGALTAFTFGLGEVILFPYVLATETTGAALDHFCVRVHYDSENKTSGFSASRECSFPIERQGVKFRGDERREEVEKRLGSPVKETFDTEIFRLGGRLSLTDNEKLRDDDLPHALIPGRSYYLEYYLIEPPDSKFSSFCIEVGYAPDGRISRIQARSDCNF